MGPNARIWLTYLDESRIFDTQKCEEWQDGLGVLIVFVRGLYVAFYRAHV